MPDCTQVLRMSWRRVPKPFTGVELVGLPPARRTSGRSGRAPYSTQRPRQLTDEERGVIRSLAKTKTLRSLAADFGVSHETVRRMLRDAEMIVT